MRRLGILALGALLILCGYTFALADEPAPSGDTTAVMGQATAPAEDAVEAPADVAASEDVAAPEESAAPAKKETAAAPEAAPQQNAYGFMPDDIAVNQGAVVYWYAHGYANAFGHLPSKWADLIAAKLPLRAFVSPHTGEDIDFDDGSLDFDGDMTYSANGYDAMIQVQTSAGVVTLPGTLSNLAPCGKGCCDISICGWENWGCMCPDDAVCKIIQWMMWKSFETYECRYGCRPTDELQWYASGFAPVDKNWKELAPQMSIEFIYHKCSLVKAKVNCCSPCQTKCGSPCPNKCNSCAKPACGSCAKSSCGSCAKSSCNSCGKSECGGKCGKCQTKCKSSAKPACGSCAKSSCGSCAKSSCNKCSKSSCGGKCGKCHSNSKCGSCDKNDCRGNCGRGNASKCKADSGCNRCGGKGCNNCQED